MTAANTHCHGGYQAGPHCCHVTPLTTTLAQFGGNAATVVTTVTPTATGSAYQPS